MNLGLVWTARHVKYSDDQPRDDHGRWTSGGESEGGAAVSLTGHVWDQPIGADGRPVPIKVDTVEQAIPMVLAGKVVELPDTKSAATLVDELGQFAQAAKAQGKDAPNFNMCNISVAGSNLFCGADLRDASHPNGYPRIEMPQLGGIPVAGTPAASLPRNPWNKDEVDGTAQFIESLKSAGITTKDDVVNPGSLKATQNELVGTKVAALMHAKIDTSNELFISSDNYVLDGHHRWAAEVGQAAERGSLGSLKVPVHRANATISELLPLAQKWSRAFGIQQNAGVGGHKAVKDCGCGSRQKYSDDEPRDDHGRWTSGGDSGVSDTFSPNTFFSRLSHPDGGFTVSPVTGEEPSGAGHYAVSIYPEAGKVIDGKDLTPKDLYAYAKSNAGLLARPGHYMGGWHDPETGKIYLDVSVITRDPKQAETLARTHNQLAYFDFGAGKSVPVEQHGQGKAGATGSQQDRGYAGTRREERGGHVRPPDWPTADARGTGKPARGDRGRLQQELAFDAAVFDYTGEHDLAARCRSFLTTPAPSSHGAVRLAATQEPDLVRALVHAWQQAQRNISLGKLVDAIRHGQTEFVVRLIQASNINRYVSDALEPRLQKAFLAGVQHGGKQLRPFGVTVRGPSATLNLTTFNPRAVAWAEQHAAELLQADSDVREMVRLLTAEAETGAATWEQLANAVRAIVGLTVPQAQSVASFQAKLIADGLDNASVTTRTEQYADAQLRSRSQTIARTELMAATNGGQQAAWKEAVHRDLIDPDTMVKQWIVTDDNKCCDDCEALDGETADIGDEFSSGDEAPPAHPNCRCTTGLIRAEDA